MTLAPDLQRAEQHGCPRCKDPVAWTKCWACGWRLHGQEAGAEGVATSEGVEPSVPVLGALDNRNEKERQTAVVKTFRDAGFWTWNLSQARATQQAKGLPDFIVTGRGAVVFVEMKGKKGRLSNAQKQFRGHVLANNGLYVVLRSESEAIRWIDGWINGLPSRGRT